MTEPGDKAPAFTLETEAGTPLSLKDFKGRWLVLYFYPKDDTSGCTKEAIAFSDALGDFDALGADVLGVSKDPVTKHAKFRDKHGLTVPLASDEEGKTVEAYGAWVEKSMYGKAYMGIDRSTFLIDPKGIIREAWRKVRVPGHVDKVREALKSHQ